MQTHRYKVYDRSACINVLGTQLARLQEERRLARSADAQEPKWTSSAYANYNISGTCLDMSAYLTLQRGEISLENYISLPADKQKEEIEESSQLQRTTRMEEVD